MKELAIAMLIVIAAYSLALVTYHAVARWRYRRWKARLHQQFVATFPEDIQARLRDSRKP